jgi:hypothetical protein
MHNAVHKEGYRLGRTSGVTRIAVATVFGGLALATLVLLANLESGRIVLSTALAASDNSNAGGNGKGKGRDNAPGRQATDDVAESGATGIAEAGATMMDSDGTAEEPVMLPVAEDGPGNTNVINEIAGLAGEAELSEEEELEAIRNGWGTWRTADGPETVITQ